MSHPEPTADDRAAQAVIGHHAELAATLDGLIADLVGATDRGDAVQAMLYRNELARWLHNELLPHAFAEEATMYPAAAAFSSGKLLVDGMMEEHRALVALVSELEAATRPVPAAAAARALGALFATHLLKENELVLPLLTGSDKVSLAGLLDGMHDLIGVTETTGGCGGACGCGGDAPAASGAQAPVLSIDPRIDVRDVPHAQRHTRVLGALDALPADGALVLVAPHAPRPLLAEIDLRYGGQISTEWLQEGPEVWQVRLQRVPAPTPV